MTNGEGQACYPKRLISLALGTPPYVPDALAPDVPVAVDLSGMTACRCGEWLCKLEPVRVVNFL